MNRIEELIKKLSLVSHPEGGYFAEVYRSKGLVPGNDEHFPTGRAFGTSIYFLLSGDDTSKFHRIKSDETWHFYEGSPIEIHMIFEDGTYQKKIVGKLNGEIAYQFTVPAGCWFGASVSELNSYTLVGCTVAPGFDFKDFEMGDRDALLSKYPKHSEIIKKLT